MKKIIAVFVAVVMLASLCSVSAFAADPQSHWVDSETGTPEADFNGNSVNADVTITVDGELVHVYAVDITYEDLSFTYSSGSKWDPVQHQYVPGSPATWLPNEKTVTITNHSDLPVWYSASKADVDQTYGPLDVVFNGTESAVAPTEIAKCEVNGTPNTGSFKVSVTGTPEVAEIKDVVISKVTVTISKTNG